jgi:hypothetical protein
LLLRSYCLNRSLKKVLTPLTSYDDRPDCTSIPAVGDNPKRPACDRPDTPEGDVVFRHHLQDGARRHRLKAPGWRYRSGRSPVRLKFRNPRRSLPKRSTEHRTFCRCMNIPARYCTGYLGDIGVPPDPAPMDFSAWFEAFVGGRWHT